LTALIGEHRPFPRRCGESTTEERHPREEPVLHGKQRRPAKYRTEDLNRVSRRAEISPPTKSPADTGGSILCSCSGENYIYRQRGVRLVGRSATPKGEIGDGMTVEIIRDKDTWDSFVDESRSGLLFHKWDFLRITEDHTGYRFLPYGIYKGEELISVFPLFCKNVHGLKTAFSPPPLQAVIPYLGFVMGKEYDLLKQSKKESFLEMISEDINTELGDFSPSYLSVTLVPEFLDIRHFIWNRYSAKVHYTYTVDLTQPSEDIWSSFHYKLRNSLKKASAAGMELVRETDISPVYQALSDRFSQPSMNIPMISKRYFEDLFRAYPQHLGIYSLYDRSGELVGTVTTQEYKRFLLWMGTPRMENAGNGNAYLQWLLMLKAQENGFSRFENIGANTRNLNYFKSKFGFCISVYLELYRKNTLGTLAEWTYSNIINKNWLKRRVISYVE
jgi:hypothetical protein